MIGPQSNQYLFDADEYAYLLTHYHYTDDMQRMTGCVFAPQYGARRGYFMDLSQKLKRMRNRLQR